MANVPPPEVSSEEPDESMLHHPYSTFVREMWNSRVPLRNIMHPFEAEITRKREADEATKKKTDAALKKATAAMTKADAALTKANAATKKAEQAMQKAKKQGRVKQASPMKKQRTKK